MQFLKLPENLTLSQLTKIVGDRNVDDILAANKLTRSPKIGEKFNDLVERTISEINEVDWKQKVNILNTLTDDVDVFEEAAMMSSEGWKVMMGLGTFIGRIKIPEDIVLPDSTDILGSPNNPGVPTQTYTAVITSLTEEPHEVDPGTFNTYSTIQPRIVGEEEFENFDNSVFTTFFNLPWGKMSIYSSLLDEMIDIPVYPEEVEDSRKANYTTMPDTIYQYEPWQAYESSGPRSNSYKFHFHRDMWTGNHLDGKANELIRFCQANCYPKYNGSLVNTGTVTLYMNGQILISGVLTDVSTNFSGPIGLDGFYLDCEMTLDITEVAQTPLNFDTIRELGIIG